MIVIIAEKPSVARELARIVGANVKREGYLEGNGYAVTWAFGHLVQIVAPESDVPWRAENLPVLPAQFFLQPGMTTGPEGKKVTDKGYERQLTIIKGLFDQAEYIVNAGDAGREGELIQRYIYAYVGCTRPVKRLWISSLTDNAIREGLAQLHENSEFDTLYAAGKARSEADWLVGINATRALSVIAGKGVRSLGRVQTPTLAMVCRRYLENRDFVPQNFWNLKASSRKNGISFTAVTKDRYSDKDRADADMARILSSPFMVVTKMEKKQKSLQPPYLYDLTSLQKDANKKYNMSAQDTLDTAQSLYEKKVLTYPRTGSRFVPDDVFKTLPSLLKLEERHPVFGQFAASLAGAKLGKHSVDATKVTDHHALLPTEVFPGQLSDWEQKIYDLVVARLLEAVSPKCDMVSTNVEFNASDVTFTAKGNVIVRPGWKAVGELLKKRGTQPAAVPDSGKDEEEQEQDLPPFAEGETLPVSSLEMTEGRTKPKPLHTEATLLEAMEHAGREIEDEELKVALKDVGIGTPATRAGEIETLLRRQYILRKGKSLIPTDIGLSIYDCVKDKYIANVEMTGKWETSLSRIVDGKVSAAAFDQSIRRYVVALTSEILNDQAARARLMAAAEPDSPKCPKCGGPMRNWEKNFRCRACGLSVWKEVAHTVLPDETVLELINTGKTGLIKGFTSKAGNSFDAALKFDQECRVVFDFSVKA